MRAQEKPAMETFGEVGLCRSGASLRRWVAGVALAASKTLLEFCDP